LRELLIFEFEVIGVQTKMHGFIDLRIEMQANHQLAKFLSISEISGQKSFALSTAIALDEYS
jgi:hypothetical protein